MKPDIEALARAEPPAPQPSARWALAALALSVLLSSLGTSIANVALPLLEQVFGASFQQVQWIVLAYLLASTTLIVSVGRLSDMLGRRRLLLAGIALFTLASVAAGIASAFWMLIAARAAQGLGAAVMMAVAMASVGDTVPKDRTGRAMGLLATMSAVGTALGPTLGGLLIAGLGWRAIFLVKVPLGLIAFAIAFASLPAERRDRVPVRFDIAGTVLLALTLAAYALAVTWGRGHFGALNLALLLAAAGGLIVFVLVEMKSPAPLLQPAMVKDRGLRAGLATSLLVSTVMMTTLVVGPFYLDRALGLDAVLVGLVLSSAPLAAALTGMPAGRIADRFGAPRMTVAGLGVMTLGCVALAVLPRASGIAGYAVPMIVVTLGYALFQTANNTGVMAEVRAEQRGVVSGMLNLSRNLGLITGASVMGAVFAFASAVAAGPEAEAVATGMRVTFAVSALMIGAAVVLALTGRPAAGR